MDKVDLGTFCRELPKIELHAHLNGSLSQATLHKLKCLHADAGRSDTSNAFLDEFNIAAGDSRNLKDCFQIFSIAHSLTNTPDALALATELTLQEFQEDGCVYIELRSTPRQTEHMTREQYVETIVEAIKQASRHLSIIAKLIISIDRRMDSSAAEEITNMAVKYYKMFPNIVVGIELSGDPSAGKFRDFEPALSRARIEGMKISLHCGEICNPEEVLYMMWFAPERIGHAVFVHPRTGGTKECWEKLRLARIPVELCLTSNVKCKLYPNYEQHHFKEFYYGNVPIAICTDDKGVFSTSLSHEMCVAAETFALSRSQLARLSLETCQYVFCDNSKKILQDKILNFIDRHSL